VEASASALSGLSVKALKRRKPAHRSLYCDTALKVMRYLYQLKQKEPRRSSEQVVFYFTFFKKWLNTQFWVVVYCIKRKLAPHCHTYTVAFPPNILPAPRVLHLIHTYSHSHNDNLAYFQFSVRLVNAVGCPLPPPSIS
jgi:hypothetical protein